jgi:hypothetical protein
MGNLPPNGKYNGSGESSILLCKKIKVIEYKTKINLILIDDKIVILDNNIYHVIRYEQNNDTGVIIHTYNGNYKNKHITGCEKYTFVLPPS